MKSQVKSATGKISGPDKFLKFITKKGNTVYNFLGVVFLMSKDRKIFKENEARINGFFSKIAWQECTDYFKVKPIQVGKSEFSEVVTLLKRDRPGVANLVERKRNEDRNNSTSLHGIKKKLNGSGDDVEQAMRTSLKKLNTKKFLEEMGTNKETVEERKNGEDLRLVYTTEKKEE